MVDDKFDSLKSIDPPPPSVGAKEIAIAAAMAAYEQEFKKNQKTVQGSEGAGRLMSIFNILNGSWIMKHRAIVGAVAVCAIAAPFVITQLSRDRTGAEIGTGKTDTGASTSGTPELKKDRETDATAPTGSDKSASGKSNSGDTSSAVVPPVTTGKPKRLVLPTSEAEMADESRIAAGLKSSAGGRRHARFQSSGRLRSFRHPVATAPGYTAPGDVIVRREDRDRFSKFDDNPQKLVKEEPVSTFSVDVDTASYAFVRRMLNQGTLPPKNAVRVEELVNYFTYDYPAAEDKARPFKPTVAVYPSPWNKETKLLHIGIKGVEVPVEARKPANLVFLLDVSGSMNSPDKLPLLKSAFSLLVSKLGSEDTVSIVTYAGRAGTALEPTKASDKAKILAALDGLTSGGSTAGAAGIRQAYALAQQSFVRDGVNRVILATDGDFNVGISDPEKLKEYIAEKRKTGIFLSVLGFGQGNLNDSLMQTLAQNGNGNAAYIDSLKEARKVLVQQAGGTLFTIAKDVKIQVEFNPAVVAEYRLVGYETRALKRQDFNNDKVDAGDIGSGHTVTAIYEITPVGSKARLFDDLRYGKKIETGAGTGTETGKADEIAFLKMRYKLPNEDTSKLIERPVTLSDATDRFDDLSADIRFAAAVAGFGQKLRGSNSIGAFGYSDVLKIARAARGKDEEGYRAEFIGLAGMAESLAAARSAATKSGND